MATAVGGLHQLLTPDPGVAETAPALLVPPGDPAAMAVALGRVLGDRTLAAALSAAGRVRAAGWPDEDHTARAVAAALVRVRLLAWDSVER